MAVADGLAISPHSAHASLAAVKAVQQQWQPYLGHFNTVPKMSLSAIAETVAFSNHRYDGAATTLALVYRLMAGNQVTIKYIGDRRVYLQRDNQWQCFTQDHTVLNELKKSRWYPAIKDLASA